MQEDDFPDLRAYNDYLERVEDIVFNLANELGVVETESEIKRFKEENADAIERNRKRLTPEEMRINQILEEECQRVRRAQITVTEQKVIGH